MCCQDGHGGQGPSCSIRLHWKQRIARLSAKVIIQVKYMLPSNEQSELAHVIASAHMPGSQAFERAHLAINQPYKHVGFAASAVPADDCTCHCTCVAAGRVRSCCIWLPPTLPASVWVMIPPLRPWGESLCAEEQLSSPPKESLLQMSYVLVHALWVVPLADAKLAIQC
jgi:hypothetical protein